MKSRDQPCGVFPLLFMLPACFTWVALLWLYMERELASEIVVYGRLLTMAALLTFTVTAAAVIGIMLVVMMIGWRLGAPVIGVAGTSAIVCMVYEFIIAYDSGASWTAAFLRSVADTLIVGAIAVLIVFLLQRRRCLPLPVERWIRRSYILVICLTYSAVLCGSLIVLHFLRSG